MTDPRIEAAAKAARIAWSGHDDWDGAPNSVRIAYRDLAIAALAAADKAATITTVVGLDALPGGASILHDEGFQKLPAKRSVDDGHWYVTGSNEYRRAETLLPARVLRWGTA